jgi:hypothetical protein
MKGLALCAAGWAGTVAAATAVGPICDTAARVNCSPYTTPRTSLDISNGTCSEWNHRGMISGSVYYRYYGGCANTCLGDQCNGGAGNYYVVTGSNGWDFRMLHISANANSYSKTCDRCALGLVGATGSATSAHSHSDNRQYGTRASSWITAPCDGSGYCGNIVGYPTL